jgi:hypothetical protein
LLEGERRGWGRVREGGTYLGGKIRSVITYRGGKRSRVMSKMTRKCKKFYTKFGYASSPEIAYSNDETTTRTTFSRRCYN